MARNNREITVDVEVNVESAIKGLKALQREAKETSRVLRELEAQIDRVNDGDSQ
ncbi:hypothetical protein [Psychrobacillus sp. OK032]|uniref:hypothetical protein n=1 Tax=Psychrobacillus sp. OK032 TaxID=1884358 RepID=UPI0008C74FA0|nr:hypothetical protein [Psychrobacillus sp. OK032]SER87608.1 hypothetical protein SAMN05518872_102448 [Psychrobacillus sp. OK032]